LQTGRLAHEKTVKGLYQRPDSGVFWASYQDASGRRVRESLKTNDRHTAERLLLDKLGRIARGEQLLPRADKIKYDELRGDLIVYYETRETRDLAEARARLKHLDRFFVGRRAVTINPDVVTKYAGERQKAGAANGTVNRELATLSKMLHLARANGKLQVVPVIEKLREADPRVRIRNQGAVRPDRGQAARRAASGRARGLRPRVEEAGSTRSPAPTA
jgi:hypothetical protein